MRHAILSHVRHSLILLAITTPALAQVPADRRGAACLARAVETLDDRTSDARSIAAAAVARCRELRAQALKEMRPSFDEAAISRALDGLREQDVDSTTAVVLEWRRRSR